MAKISIINRNSAMKKIKRFAKLGVAAATIYGAVWTAPKVVNQYNLSSNRAEITKQVNDRDYEGALKRFEQISEIGFIVPKTLERERSSLFEAIRVRKTNELEELIRRFLAKEDYELHRLLQFEETRGYDYEETRSLAKGYNYDYSSALNFLAQFKNEDFFSAEDLKNLEAKVQEISPKGLMKQAENTDDLSRQISLYILAERGFEKEGEQEPTLRGKLINVSLIDIASAYEIGEVGTVFSKVNRLVNYLESKKNDPAQVGNEETGVLTDIFFDASNGFIGRGLIEGRLGLSLARDYLAQINSLARLLDVKDREQKVRTLAQLTVKQVGALIKDKNYQYHEVDVLDLDILSELSQGYSPESFGDVVELYLVPQGKIQKNSLLTKSFLDSGLMQSELLPVERQKKIRMRIADGYVGLARTISDTARKDAYLMLQTARGLYFDSGLKQEDKRISDLDSFVHRNFGNKN